MNIIYKNSASHQVNSGLFHFKEWKRRREIKHAT